MKKLLFASIMFATVCFSSVANAQTRSLVVYFSHSGNTESIAQQIKTFTGADILEIIPEKAYPEDYQSVVDQAKAEINAGIKPAIKPCITDIARVYRLALLVGYDRSSCRDISIGAQPFG